MTTAAITRESRGNARGRWQVWALTLAVLSAFALALNLSNPTAAHAQYPGPNPPQAPADCNKPWVILSAYGTSESTDSGHPYGTVGVNDTYIRALKSALSDAACPRQRRHRAQSPLPGVRRGLARLAARRLGP